MIKDFAFLKIKGNAPKQKQKITKQKAISGQQPDMTKAKQRPAAIAAGRYVFNNQSLNKIICDRFQQNHIYYSNLQLFYK